jgi:hypothetical protein
MIGRDAVVVADREERAMNETTSQPAVELHQPRFRRVLNTARRRWIATAAAAITLSVAGVSAGLAASSAPAPSAQAPVAAGPAGGFGAGPGAGTSNARSGPAQGGSVGTVSAAGSGFTLRTAGGQDVTVVETPATTYTNGTSPAAVSDVTVGAPVLVLGTTNNTTITATQVVVHPPGTSSSAATVVPFQRGAPTTSKSVGRIPAGYTQGSGTIVSGTAADSAIKAALASYPGGVVDRVVQLSSGEYEVHNIGVSWPHHVFVDQSFQVIGAN